MHQFNRIQLFWIKLCELCDFRYMLLVKATAAIHPVAYDLEQVEYVLVSKDTSCELKDYLNVCPSINYVIEALLDYFVDGLLVQNIQCLSILSQDDRQVP